MMEKKKNMAIHQKLIQKNNNNVGEHDAAGLKQRAQGTKSTSNEGGHEKSVGDTNQESSSKEHMA